MDSLRINSLSSEEADSINGYSTDLNYQDGRAKHHITGMNKRQRNARKYGITSILTGATTLAAYFTGDAEIMNNTPLVLSSAATATSAIATAYNKIKYFNHKNKIEDVKKEAYKVPEKERNQIIESHNFSWLEKALKKY